MRSILCALVLAAPGFAGEKAIVEFHLKKSPTVALRGWLLDFDDEEFRFERFGAGRKLHVRWADVVPEDRAAMRRQLKLDLSEDEAKGLMPGHRIHFRNGGFVEGLLVMVDEERRHWVRHEGHLLPYPADRIERVEKVKVREDRVFDADDVYLRRLERIPPKTARQHRRLADRMADLGNLERAKAHYEEAIRLRPEWKFELAPQLDELEELMRDAVVARMLRKVRSLYRLHKDYDGAREELARFMERYPDRRRAALRLLDDVEERHAEELRLRFSYVKNDEFRRAIDDYTRRMTSLDEALGWVRAKLPDELEKRIAKRMGIEPDEVEAYLKQERTGAPHWASYRSGSFIFSKRARKGKTTRKKIRGDPDKWWGRYADGDTRGAFLRAYAAERLDLFEVVQVRLRECSSCGGTGQKKQTSVNPLNALGGHGGNHAGHDWSQLCRRCFGGCRDRSVAYR